MTVDSGQTPILEVIPLVRARLEQIQTQSSLTSTHPAQTFAQWFSSGGSEREQGIGKDGNKRVRVAMVELAWLWLRWQPDSTLSAWFRERVGQAGGRIKKIMIVALARKLLVALWRYAKDGVIPEGAKMKTA